jgi:hypothetical protein
MEDGDAAVLPRSGFKGMTGKAWFSKSANPFQLYVRSF